MTTLTSMFADVLAQRAAPTSSPTAATRDQRDSQATAIVKLAKETGAQFFHTPMGDSYIRIQINGHPEHHRLPSKTGREYLTRLYFRKTGKAPNATSLQDAMATLSGIAKFDGDEHAVHVRVAGDDQQIYLHLGDGLWRTVEISSAGWRIITDPPVRFRRPRGMLPLPVPVTGGSLNELRTFVNVTDEDFPLVAAWAIAALRPRGPYTVLDLIAEQGAGKSTTARVMRRLVDPHESELRRPPRSTEDVMIAAANSYIVTIDNVSHLPDWLSDDLATLSTGGGLSKRELYSDSDECILTAQRPIVLNGIGHVIHRADLLDRAIVLTLPAMPDDRRQPEADFWRGFEQARPRILGALLDCVTMALRNHATTTLKSLPRMADFAVWNVAAEPACPWSAGRFMEGYLANRHGAVEVGLDGDPVVDVVRALAPWEGTASAFLSELTQRTAEHITKRRDWFCKPRQVSDALRRLAPGLRRTGIEVTFTRAPHTGRRMVRLEKTADISSPPSPTPKTRRLSGEPSGDGIRHSSPSSPASSPKNSNRTGAGDAGDGGDAPSPFSSDEVSNGGRF